MKILAIDSSAKVSTAAICDEDKIIAEFAINTTLTHSQTLMPMVEALLKYSDTSLSEIDYYAISHGPGSFTGLRIGIAAIKGMAFARKKPCIGISTLEALALNATNTEGIVCAAMDARCGQVYTAIFSSCSNGEIERLSDDMAISLDELSSLLEKYNKNIFFVGDGAILCYNKLVNLKNKFILSPASRFQSASNVALAARKYIESGETISAAELMPHYLRLPQAQRELKKKQSTTEGV